MKETEGYMPYKGYKTWYKIVGEPSEDKAPVILLHGGPGACHYYMEPYEVLAERFGRQVITYDQIGCGNSPIPHQEDDFYNIQLWVDELDALREYLGIKECHLLGHSWGTILAMEYVLAGKGEGVKSIILASGLCNIDLWLEEANRYVSYLPDDLAEAIREGNETGDYSSEKAQEGMGLYYARHVEGAGEEPECIQKSFEGIGECYVVMQGEAEFVVTGKLKDWDVVDRLKNINVPALMISGNDDESTPLINKTMYDNIPDSEWVLIPHGTHMGHCYNPEPYVTAVEEYMERKDRN